MRMKKIFMKLPDVIKGPILRSQIRIDETKLDGTTFKIADTTEELENAYGLVHDVYVKEGYMDPHPSGMRITKYNLLPKTTAFVGRNNGQMVVTMSLFPDSKVGIPMDSQFKNELDELRTAGRYVAEVGNLASEPGFRNKNQNIPMHANKIMHTYAYRYLSIDDLVIAINPKHKWFYKNILLFQQISKRKDYGYVKGAPAVAMKLDLRELKRLYQRTYSSTPPRDLHRFYFQKESPSIRLPLEKKPLIVMNDDKVAYFWSIVKKTGADSEGVKK